MQGEDREGVERLLRYCARPPFALERLHAPNGYASPSSPNARLLYRFPRPTPDGRTQILLSPLQLLERLAAFVPPGTDAKRWSHPQKPLSRRARAQRHVPSRCRGHRQA
ncbi:MAG: transposase [Planctomycetota bacterium]